MLPKECYEGRIKLLEARPKENARIVAKLIRKARMAEKLENEKEN